MSTQLNRLKYKASNSADGSSCHDRLLREPPSITDRSITFLDVFDREARYPIHDRLCSLLPITEIISLTRTCKKFANLYQDLVSGQWNVDRRLRRFVQSPQTFRSRMGQHEVLISGSFALQFFARVLWEESDMDVFIEHGANANAFCEYLSTEEGYILSKSKGIEEYSMLELEEVRSL